MGRNEGREGGEGQPGGQIVKRTTAKDHSLQGATFEINLLQLFLLLLKIQMPDRQGSNSRGESLTGWVFATSFGKVGPAGGHCIMGDR